MDVDRSKKTTEFSFFPFFSAKQPQRKKKPAARTGAIAKVVSDTFQRNLR